MSKIFVLFYVILVLFTLNNKVFVLGGDSGAVGDDQDLTGADDSGEVVDGQSGSAGLVDEKDSDQSILYSTPNIDNYYIYEHFDDDQDFNNRWIRSETSKSDTTELKYDGEWALTQTTHAIKGDSCLIVKSRAKHHAISAKLDKVFKFDAKPLVLQYEVQFRNGQECGGAYIKLLSNPSGSLKHLNDKTQYSIMFGPDKCGNDMKLHFIFKHKNPKNGSVTEKHWKSAGNVAKLDEVFKDNRWHQIRLEINADDTYEVTLDKSSVGKGSLLKDFSPPVNPPKEIDDPNDTKPEDWDEREKIPDPDAVKPDDWDESEPRKIPDPKANKPEDWAEDEPEMIPDSEAKQPNDWDTEMDGEWEAPLVANPKCAQLSGCGKWSAPLIDNTKFKGKWRAPMISNPVYKGKWAPNKIRNPDYYEDSHPFTTMFPIDAVAFELWTISDGIAFDNILITDDIDVAKHISSLTYQIKKEMSDSETDNIVVKAVKYTNKYPWLWAVYVLAIGVPVVLFIAFCCVSPVKRVDTAQASTSGGAPGARPDTSGTGGDASVAQKKKTDQSTPDDDLIEDDEQKANDLEPEVEEEEAEEEEQEDDEEEEESDKTEEESEKEDEKEEPVAAARSSPRLRKTRARKD